MLLYIFLFLILVLVCYISNLDIYVHRDGHLQIFSPFKWDFYSDSNYKTSTLNKKDVFTLRLGSDK